MLSFVVKKIKITIKTCTEQFMNVLLIYLYSYFVSVAFDNFPLNEYIMMIITMYRMQDYNFDSATRIVRFHSAWGVDYSRFE